jgi:hypothetical protein
MHCVRIPGNVLWLTFLSQNNRFDVILNDLHRRKHNKDFARSHFRGVVATQTCEPKATPVIGIT